jgi:hypothetical protein
MPAEQWMPDKKSLTDQMHELRGLLDHRVPRVLTIPELSQVAERLCPTLEGLAGLLAAVQLAADKLPDNRGPVAELLYGLTDESRGQPVKARRQLALAKFREVVPKAEQCTYESFRCNDERELIEDLATILIDLVGPSPERTTTASIRWRLPHRLVHIPTLMLVAAVLIVGGVTAWVSTSQSTPPPTAIAQLASEAERNLTGGQAPGPGTVTRELGFGDPTPGGRKTYEFEATPPLTATLDSMVLAPLNPLIDERRFLGVQASAVTDARQLVRPSTHAILAPPHTIVWLSALVDNNADPTKTCMSSGKQVSSDTRLLLSIWNSPNNYLHIMRAWITADDTEPPWITDAVAVITTAAATLEPDSSISREHAFESGTFAMEPLINVESLLVEPGLLVGEEGLVGTCQSDNSYLVMIGFRQVENQH